MSRMIPRKTRSAQGFYRHPITLGVLIPAILEWGCSSSIVVPPTDATVDAPEVAPEPRPKP